ncbi:MAG TPA: TatD family hydrolase, partial [Patescibacteria group bacterium]|nr:TatD family hydrolase [Patescibacteria group bacterium]
KKYEGLYTSVGIHPHHADKLEENWEKDLEELAKEEKVVAIGETGMDYFRYKSNGVTNTKIQEELFVKQIKIANKLSLPLQIHNRQAGEDILKILTKYKSILLNKPGVFHCFSGDLKFLEKVLKLNFYIGFDGNITYKGIAKGETTALSDLVKETPLNRIITETDSPFLTPIPHRGSRNEPIYVIIVASFIAQIKEISKNKVIEKTTENAHTLFNKL